MRDLLSSLTRFFRLPRATAALMGAGVAAASLQACAPNLGPAPTLKPASGYATTQSFAAPAADWPADAWWTAYNDPALNALETQALSGTPDLAMAAARLSEAQATVVQASGVNQPSFAVNATSQTTKQSLNEGFPPSFKGFLPSGYHTQSRATLDMQWDLDFFGAQRNRLRAATGAAEAAEAEVAAARLQISTAVAGAYAELGRLYADRDAAAEAVAIRRQTLDLVGRRLANGLETKGEYAQAEGGVPETQRDVDALDRQIVIQRHAMAALLGLGPDAGLAIPRPADLGARAFGLPATVSIDLVGRRPDLTAARLRVQAAAKREKAARADYYPNISINGDYGLASLGIDKFTQTPDSIIGALGPALRLPIFRTHELGGALRARRGEYAEAVATYDRTLANALRDVADAATGVKSLQTELADARASLASAQEARRIAQLRYTGGLSPFLNVLTAENSLIVARRAVADLQGQAAGLDITLVRTLGGGYVDPAATLRTAAR